MTTVLVFGVFDGLHSGHIHFLKQARKFGNKLIVAIARDEVVKKLKHKTPQADEKERLELVKSLRLVDRAVAGDKKISSYKIVNKIKPDIICLGYDQKTLAADIKNHLPNITIVVTRAYRPKKMHTTKLTNEVEP